MARQEIERRNELTPPSVLDRVLPSSTKNVERKLHRLNGRTVTRGAAVQAEGVIAREKQREVDHLTREAITGQAMLRKWADTLAGSDPLMHDDIAFFADMARIGKGQVISDLIATYARESDR